jgi:CubicO group peptidase (beta-lactamase class C family)
MKTCIGLAICCLAFAAMSCAPPSSIPMTGDWRAQGVDPRYATLLDEIEQMARQTMSRNRIPGLSIALADSHGPIWQAGFGFADDARRIPVDGDTIFSIQSMSKTFTAVGVLTAVRDGLLDLDTPISRYLPAFQVQSIFEDRPQDRITLRHLLTHTAGFTHEAPAGNNNDPGAPSFDGHVASIQDTWLMARVGERYHYSNLGFDLAGYIVQQTSGRALPDYMKEKVFEPLDLRRTTEDAAAIRAESNRATGHQPGFRDMPVIVPMTAAGGVYSSAHDLGKFLSSMLREGRGGGQLLPPQAFREMETTPMHGGYGLGVNIGRRQDDLFFEHGGGGYGFLTYMAWYPTLDIGITVLTNSSMHNGAHVALAQKVVDRLAAAGVVTRKFALPYLPVCAITLGKVKDDSWYFDAHPEKAKWRDEWGRYFGSYRLAVNASPRWYARLALSVGIPKQCFVKVSRRGDGLVLDGVPLLEQEPGLFFTKMGEALDFRTDPPTWRNIKLHRR